LLLPFLRDQIAHLIEHIFDEDAISHGGVADEDVGDGADELSVLDDGAAAHECGQERTTKFTKKCF